MLIVGCSDDVGKLEKFFDGGKYGNDQVSRVLCHILGNFFVIKEFVSHQLTIVFLQVS